MKKKSNKSFIATISVGALIWYEGQIWELIDTHPIECSYIAQNVKNYERKVISFVDLVDKKSFRVSDKDVNPETAKVLYG